MKLRANSGVVTFIIGKILEDGVFLGVLTGFVQINDIAITCTFQHVLEPAATNFQSLKFRSFD